MSIHRPWRVLSLALLTASLCACYKLSFSGIGKLDDEGADFSSKLSLTATGHVGATLDAFAKLAADTGGVQIASASVDAVPADIKKIIYTGIPQGRPVDLVFVVDTTGSMSNDISAVRAQLRSIQDVLAARSPDHRVGLVAYRDRGDSYVSRTVLALSSDQNAVRTAINSLEVGGGGDFPEHVYAGLDTALEQPWRAGASRHILLLGDAPPHDYRDDPRNRESVVRKARAEGRAVAIHAIVLSCGRLCRAELGL